MVREGAGVAQLTVRDVPEDVLQVLRNEAAKRHTSMNAMVCIALEAYSEQMRRRDALRALVPELTALRQEILGRRGEPTSDSAEWVRADRER